MERSTRLLRFFLLTYAISWSLWIPIALSSRGLLPVEIPLGLGILGIFGPGIAALTLKRASGGRLRDLLGPLRRWRFGIRWFGFALLSTVTLLLGATGIAVALANATVDVADLLP